MRLLYKIEFNSPTDILEGDVVVRMNAEGTNCTTNSVCYCCNEIIPSIGTKTHKIRDVYFAVCGSKRCNFLLSLYGEN